MTDLISKASKLHNLSKNELVEILQNDSYNEELFEAEGSGDYCLLDGVERTEEQGKSQDTENRRDDFVVIECRNKGACYKENRITDRSNQQAYVEYRGCIGVVNFFFLDKCGVHAACNEDLRYRYEDSN